MRTSFDTVGVTKKRSTQWDADRYQTRITIEGRTYYLGTYTTRKKADQAFAKLVYYRECMASHRATVVAFGDELEDDGTLESLPLPGYGQTNPTSGGANHNQGGGFR
jgi:hypothetical protein